MLTVERKQEFLKTISKIKDPVFKEKVIKQIEKIVKNPEIGKPMRHNRKGTREVHISPYRLAYAYLKNENKIIFLDIYHKDEQ
ncbi:type II toxin-antitoxin system RelE/ParE family toxin [Candidatus Woesearchaeota archaeon]|nr:MAG: type II toxin-antitoxin system RelE/ParE family toxin [Candidatus Woesearchaeota archaeon]